MNIEMFIVPLVYTVMTQSKLNEANGFFKHYSFYCNNQWKTAKTVKPVGTEGFLSSVNYYVINTDKTGNQIAVAVAPGEKYCLDIRFKKK